MSKTPRTDAARARCGFADMAKMERELAILLNALESLIAEADLSDDFESAYLEVGRSFVDEARASVAKVKEGKV